MSIIDIHCHWGKWPFPSQHLTAADMAANARQLGIKRSISSSVEAIVYDFRSGNLAMAEAIAPYPELLGYVTINLNYPEQGLQEVDRYLDRSKFVGVKIHPLYSRQTLDGPNGRFVAAGLAERRCPLLIHTYSGPLEVPRSVVPVAKTYPELTIIMAHMGGDRWEDGLDAALQCPNLYVDPCATWADAGKIEAAVRRLGADRLLFGSDYSLFSVGYSLGMIEDAVISSEERELILHGNAERLFGI